MIRLAHFKQAFGDGRQRDAENFNSLGGIEYDAVNDRLIVGDNGLEEQLPTGCQ